MNFSDVESVAWFEVTETRESRKLIAALGLRTQAGVRRIGWCTLTTRVETWSYGDGLLQITGRSTTVLATPAAMGIAIRIAPH
jgi:hypothetical protein